MWVGEILDGDLNPVQEYFLRGPSIKIGRSVDNSLVFAADKSISRVHAEIVIDHTASTVHVVDLASRYGSSVNGTRLVGNSPYRIEHGVVARFGVGNIRIRFTKRTYLYCTTRLDKAEKDRLKRCAKITGGRIVSQIEHATHVVASKAAATVKMLTALVVPLKMVRAEWLGFAEGINPAELIPREEEFFPSPSDDVTVHDPKHSRSSLLSSYVVFLLNAYDAQYAAICRACGAAVVECSKEEEEKGLSALEVITQYVHATVNNNTTDGVHKDKFCVFFDESRGIDCDKIMMNECRETLLASGAQKSSREDSMLTWLTAGQFAAAIINFTAPVLLQDPPKASKVPGGGASQSQFSAPSHSFLPSQSQLQSPTPPAARVSVTSAQSVAVLPIPVTKNVSIRDTAGPERALPPLPPSHTARQGHGAAVSTHMPVRIDSSRGGTMAEHTLAETSPANALSRHSSTHANYTTPAASSAHKASSTDRMLSIVKEEPAVVVAAVQEQEVVSIVVTSSSSSARKRGREVEDPEASALACSTTVPAPDSADKVTSVPQSVSKGVSEDALFGETPRAKRARPGLTSAADLNLTALASPPARRIVPVHTLSFAAPAENTERRVVTSPRAVSVRSVVQESVVDVGGWFEALRGQDRTQAVQIKRNKAEQMDAEDDECNNEGNEPRRKSFLPQPATVEKDDLICAFIGDAAEPRRILNSIGSASSSSSSSSRNVKVFRKNVVRSIAVRERMSFTNKQLVLPKESERQIQLRLEADAREEMERHADHMMSEKFATSSKKKVLK